MYDCELLWLGLFSFIPCEFCSQFNWIYPSVWPEVPLASKDGAEVVDIKFILSIVTASLFILSVVTALFWIFASTTESVFNLAESIVSSDGTPIERVSPRIKMKSIESPVCRLLAKVICDPEIVKLDPGFCIIEFKLQMTWFALCGANAEPPLNKL